MGEGAREEGRKRGREGEGEGEGEGGKSMKEAGPGKDGERAGLEGSRRRSGRGASIRRQTWRPRRGGGSLKKLRCRSSNPKTIRVIHTTIWDSNHQHHGDSFTALPTTLASNLCQICIAFALVVPLGCDLGGCSRTVVVQ